MENVSKPTIAIPNPGCNSYLKEGKEYKIKTLCDAFGSEKWFFTIYDDETDDILCIAYKDNNKPTCNHAKGGWTLK